MGDTMRPIPFRELLRRIFEEYRSLNSIFGIPRMHFFEKQNRRRVRVFGDSCETPVGPAAGPHTQMTQNIVASYLCGGRFMELKTVQKLDSLEIEKPCIDARDEGYNTEWSTEFSLSQAYEEYIKAWILLHLVEQLFDRRLDASLPSFIFNMSIGYDLDGIKTEKMERYIEDMIDSSGNGFFRRCLDELSGVIEKGAFLHDTGLEDRVEKLKGLKTRISPRISPSVTLSTMHGCPPEEQEAICSYLLKEKKIDTYVKLNPTLLGYDRVRGILDGLGYDYLRLSRDSFSRDLQYDEAGAMLKRLTALAATEGREFGVKLSNTLGSINDQGVLPGDDMYMSGRALYPLTIRLAAVLSQDFDGKLPISYSGGANGWNVTKIFRTGIRPITLATDMLKPGGYMRMKEMALELETAEGWDAQEIEAKAVSDLADEAMKAGYTHKSFRGFDRIETKKALPLWDCYVAPCTVACPIGQDVPEYIRLVGEERCEEALDLIYEKNALPNITGYICDHQCMYNCTRLDYEGAVQIRGLKRAAAERGREGYFAGWTAPRKRGPKAAVVGAGPAGLSAAYFLAREGLEVTVFEKQPNAGGVVRNVIPHFRLPVEAIERDIEFIEKHGVKFRFGVEGGLGVEGLKAEGYEYLFFGIGAEKDNPLPLENAGAESRLRRSLDFLRDYRGNAKNLDLAGHVAVVGGGNTAMDSARAALSLDAVQRVTVLYRRSKAQMPADLEEYENAVKDGVEFRFLRNPERLSAGGTLTVRVMKLGEKDGSGRARPEKTEETESLSIDYLISAIGERVDTEALKAFGIPLGEDGFPVVDEERLETVRENVYLGGDAQSGPATVVRAIAAGRKAADDIARKAFGEARCRDVRSYFDEERVRQEVLSRKGALLTAKDEAAVGSDVVSAQAEARRCLECSAICNKCVEVCPNRANVVLPIGIGGSAGAKEDFSRKYQILHIDALCNECGNCAAFCPWEGKPYKDKFTIFSTRQDFDDSVNPGFLIEKDILHLRIEGIVQRCDIDGEGEISGAAADHDPASLDLCAAAVIRNVFQEFPYLLGERE
jgi:putative selenate reductase